MTEARYRSFLIICGVPYLLVVTLIHEIQWFFLPVHAVLLSSALPGFRWRPAHIAIGLVLLFLLAIPILTYPGNEAAVRAICDSWQGRARVNCAVFSGIGALAWSAEDLMRLSARVFATEGAFKTWLIAAALSMVPIVALYVALQSEAGALPSIGALLVILLPVLPLFALGWDWGRWLHLLATAVVAVLLSRLPNMARKTRHRRPLVTGMLVLGVVLYTTMWRLPHTGLPKTLSGGFGYHLMRALYFEGSVL